MADATASLSEYAAKELTIVERSRPLTSLYRSDLPDGVRPLALIGRHAVAV
jgi:hypothetical protein